MYADADGDGLKSVQVVTLPAAAHGALALSGTAVTANQAIVKADLGSLVFTPVRNFAGEGTFTFKVVDDTDAESAVATATVTVTGTNDAPAAGALAVSTAEDTALSFTAGQFEGVFSDPDADDSLKSVRVVTLPDAAHGALALNGTAVMANRKVAHGDLGKLTFTPVGNWHGTATFTFKVVDQSDAESAVATATITVTAVADAPAAGALGVSTAEETALTFTAAQFEGVYTDADGDGLKSVQVVSLPAAAHGALALSGTAVTANQAIVKADLGSLVFTPVTNFAGEATFTFKVVDDTDAESAAATATITVGGTNDAPAAGALGVSTSEDTALTFTAAQFEAVFTDVDGGDSLKSVRVASLPDAAYGGLALNGTAVTANQTIVKASLGSLVFTPVGDWNGTATFTFKVVDQSDAESAAATATITVSAVADAPVAGALGVSTAEETALTFTAAHFEGVYADADGDGLKSVQVVSLPAAAHGALALSGTAVTANQAIVKADLGSLVFTPVTNFAGKATFTFKVVDDTDAESAVVTATVTVTGTNDAPAAAALGVSTAEDTALTFTAAHFEGVFSDPDAGDSLKAVQVASLPAAAHGALALDGTAVTANRKVAHGDLGSLTFTPVGDWNGTATFTFKVVDQSDAESAAATATITVSAVADAPVAGALGVSTAEETALTFTAAQFEGVYTDADGDGLKAVQVVSLPAAAHGALALSGTAVTANQAIVKADLGSLVFTPVTNFAGKATFTFKVVDNTDAESAVVTATVTVTGTNDAPAAGALAVSTAEDTALTFTAAHFEGVFSDPDAGDSLKAVQVASLPAAAHGALALSGTAVTANRKVAHADLGSLTFTPVGDWNGTATFTFKVVDQSDAESAVATATITVTAVADAPAAGALGVSTAEETALTFTAAQFEGVYADADGDGLKSVQVVSLPAAAHGALALSGTAVTANQAIVKADLGSLVFTPVTNFAGKATFTFKVVDDTDAESAAATATITVSGTNDAPAAAALGVSTSEDMALSFTAAQFEAVFTDVDDGDGLKAVRVASLPAAAHGALALSGTAVTANRKVAHGDLGKLVFTPVGNWHGKATFTFKVVDQSDAESAAATATITVSAVADAPVAGALGVSTAEETALTFTAAQFEGVYADADGDGLKSVQVVTLPAAAHGALALSGTAVTANQAIVKADLGSLVFTPVRNFAGEATFTFKVVDDTDAESAVATATVTVTGTNDAPAAGALGVSTAEDTALTFTAAHFEGVFSDPDADDSLKSVRVVSLPDAAHGALALNGTAVTANQTIVKASLGSLVFTPVGDWNGTATFTFKVVDQSDAASAVATATITVSAVADAPVAGALGVSTAEETALTFTAADFEGVYADADGDGLKSVQVVSLPAAAHGALALSGTAVTANQAIVKADLGSLVFTPVTNFAGEATFTFKVVDDTDAESATATATITVGGTNDAPAAGALGVSTAEDTALTFTAGHFEGVFSDPDADDSLKAVQVVSLPAAAHGALALNGTAVTANRKVAHGDLGSLTFTPVGDWNGTATFTFKVVDQSDAASAAATATITVSAVADAPAAGALGVSTAEETALTFTAAQFEGVYTDADGDGLKSVQVVSLPAAAHGALALSGTAVTANQAIVKADLGSLVFTPVTNFAGKATFTFKVVDDTDAESAVVTATITVTGTNDAPAASALNVSTAEDTALMFTAAQFEAVFTDVDDGDGLKAVRVASLPASTAGALALSGTAVTANQTIVKASLGSLVFTPVGDWNGTATFTFKVVDQSDAASAAATATITVSAVNDAPAASALGVSTAEETALTFTAAQFEGVYADADGDGLKSVQVVSLPAAAHGALVLSGTAVTANQAIVKASLGSLKFTPVTNFAGKATFTFKVVDDADAESAVATATITVTGTNDAPAAGALAVSTAEDTALTFTAAHFEGVFSDPDAGDSLKAVQVASLPAAAHGALALNGTAVTANRKVAHGDLGKLVFTPVGDWNGTATFTFKVVDQSDAESAVATATITVSAVADAPAAGALGVSTAEDTALTFTAAQFEGVYTDADGDGLKAVQVVSLPAAAHGALALSGTAVTANQAIVKADLGSLVFTPVTNFAGEATFTFKVVDDTDAESAVVTATVTVTGTNDAPAAGALAVSTAEETALTFTAAHFEGVFSDPDAGDSLKAVQVVSLPDAAHGALALDGTAVTANRKVAHADLGSLVFTPVGDWNGTATFTFKVVDQSDAESAAATATITVDAVADAPVAGALGVSTAEETALTFTAAHFEGVFSDPDAGDSLKSVKVVSLPAAAHGALALSGTAVTADQAIVKADLGSLVFTPVTNFAGEATFTFKVVDDTDAESAVATATITVTGTNDAPAAGALGVSTSEDTALTFTAAQFEAVFTDVDDGDGLKAVRVASLPAAAHGALALSGTAVTANRKVAHGDLGKLVFTPVGNWHGKATFTFKVVDQSDAESAAATATITVSAVADAPAAGALGVSTSEDTALTFTAAQFEGLYTDADGDGLKAVRVASLPAAAHGALALSGTAVTANQAIVKADLGSLKFTPVRNFAGKATFTFKVVDDTDAESAVATATVTVSGTNDAPAAAALGVSTSEDTALSFTAAQFEAVFTDVDDGDSLKSVRVASLPASTAGALALNGTAVTANRKVAHADLGSLTFTPVGDWNGTATFTFKVVDQSDAASAAATATITVSAVADAPVAGALGVSTAEDTALTFTAAQFEGVFSDPDAGDSLKAVQVVSLPASTAGALALNGTAVTANRKVAHADLGSLTFTPVGDWNGTATFTFKVVDQSDAESAAAAATITVTGTNDAPAAGALGVSTAEDTALTFTAAQFAGVFSDPDAGDSLKEVQVVTVPDAAHGALALNGTAVTANRKVAHGNLGKLVFTPVGDWSGTATFTFKVVDQSDAESAAATATITVSAVNDAPAAAALGVSTSEDTALTFTAAQFEAVFTDVDDGDSLKSVKVVTLPAATTGVLALDGTAVGANHVIAHADLGDLTFTPKTDFAGTATFTFKMVDQSDAESAAATATVTVSAAADAPAASALGVSTSEDTALSFTAAQFEGAFSDPDTGDSLKAVKVVTLPAATAGALALSGTAVTANQTIVKASLGSLKLTPVGDWNGTATFTFKVVDQSDAASAAATATITVSAVNDAPAAAALGVSTSEDTALTFTAAQFEAVFTDVDDGDSLKAVKVVTLPAATTGVLALDGTAVGANHVIAHADLGDLTFTPKTDFAGTATFTFKVVDQSDAASAAATATVTVSAVADAPAASALGVSTSEDTALTFTAAQFEGAFSDPDAGDSLKAVKVVTLPAATAGALALSGTAVTANQTIVKASLGSLKLTPVGDWNGTATFTFKVVDQSDAASAAATATITVSAVNDAPAAAALGVSTSEDTALTFTAAQFEAVFTDVDDGDSLKAVKVVTLPAATTGVLALDGTAVGANHVIAHADLGDLTFTPKTDFAGTATFTFKVVDQSDAESGAAATATITVGGANDAPAASALNVSTTEDTALTFTAAQFEGAFSDPDTGDSLKAVKVVTLPAATAGALALGGTAVKANDAIAHGSLGTLTFTPVGNWHGKATFTFKVADQAGTESADAATATVTVTAVADAPTAGALAVSTAEDTALSFTAAQFAGVFGDPDTGDSLKSVKVVTLPAATAGALALNGSAVTANQAIAHADLGTLMFTPAADYAGTATFGFQVSDRTDRLSAAATATVTVTAVADAPTAGALAVSTAEDTALTFTAAQFAGVFSDPDAGDSLKEVQVVTVPDAAHGALALNGTAVTANDKIAHGDLGTLTFTPVGNWNGKATFTFKVVDKTDRLSAAATATVTVTAVADAPAAGALAVSTAEDTAFSFAAADFKGVFSDPDAGDSLKAVQVVSLPDAAHGALALNGTAVTANQAIAHGDLGTLTFTPVADWNGDATFTFKVVDQTDRLSAAAAATVTVTAVADAPQGAAPREPAEVPANPEDPDASLLTVSTAEDTALTFTAAQFEAVFSDPDEGDSLKAVPVVSLPDAGHGVLELSATAVTAEQTIAHGDLGGLTFTPAANWHGEATFTFKLVDQSDAASDAATATITVTAVNDAPAAAALSLSTSEDTALTFTAAQFEAVFTDVDEGDSLKAVQVVTLPAAAQGALALNGTAVTANQEVAHGDLGSLTFTPAAAYIGDATFTFKVVDQSAVASAAAATATIRVTDRNEGPVAPGTIPDQTATQGVPFTYTAPGDTFSDPDGDTLVWTAAARGPGVQEPAGGPAQVGGDRGIRLRSESDRGATGGLLDWLSFDGATYTFDGTPAEPDVDGTTIRVTATDPWGAFAYAEFILRVLPPVQVSVSGPAAPVVEGAPATFTVALSRAAPEDVTVYWATADGTGAGAATAGSDYTAQAPTDVTIAAGQTERTVAVATLVDNEDEDAETFAVQLSLATGGLPAGVELGTSSATASIVDAPPAPPPPARSPPPSDRNRPSPPDDGSLVAGRIPDQTAVESVPFTYTVPAGVFHHPDGEPFVHAAARANGGALPSWLGFSPSTRIFAGTPRAADVGTSSIRVTATDPSGASVHATFRLTVRPRARVRVSGPAEPVAEGASAIFTVALSRPVSRAVTVSWQTTDASGEGAATADRDYAAQPLTDVTLAAGQTERTVTVATLDDQVVEGAEAFTVRLSAAAGLPAGVALDRGASSATAVIEDDDEAAVSLTEPARVSEGATATVEIVLSHPVARPVTVRWATAEDSGEGAATAGSDYTAQPLTELTFAAGQTRRTVTVATLADRVVEGAETFSVRLSAAPGGLPERVTLDDGASSATVVIEDDDRATVSLAEPESVIEGATAAIEIRLSHPVARPVTVSWATAEDSGEGAATAGSDYKAQAATEVTFAAGQTRRTVTVATLDDPLVEGAETFTVRVSVAAGGLPDGVLLDPGASSVTVVIEDDDRATVSLTEPEPVREGETATIEIVLSDPVARPFTVHWATADGTATAAGGDYEPHAAAPITFEPGVMRRTVQVVTYADYLVEGTETFLVKLSAPRGLPAGVSLDVADVAVTIEDNRRPIADAGPDREVDPGVTVVLDGSASHDPDGDPITGYAWTQSAGEPVDLDAARSATPSFVAPQMPGAMSFELVVSGGGLDSLPDEVTVTVRDVAPRFLEAVAELTFTEERAIEPLTLPEAAGGNGGPLTYELTSKPAGLAGLRFDPATRVLSGTPDRHGRLAFTYVAHDADGNRTLSDAAVLTFVVTVREAPYRRILRPVLAALGRATLYGARTTIGTRFAASSAEQGGTLSVSGHHVPLEAAADGAKAAAAPGAGMPDAEWFPPAYLDRAGYESRLMSLDELLGGSAFTMPLTAAAEPAAETATADDEPGPPLRWTLWGQGHRQGFHGEPEAGASIQGDLTTVWLGLEASPADAPWLAGVAVSRSLRGGADYTIEGGDDAGETGLMEASFTALYPYLRFLPAAGTEITALLGAGLGEAVHERDGVERESGDLTLLLGAVGLRQALSSPEAWLELAVRGDGGFARLMTGAGGQAMHDLVAVAANVRLGVEAAARLPLAGGELRPFVEAAGRYDGGDDVTGAGLEVAGGLRYAMPGFELEARGRLLALHTAADYGEHGLSVTARVGPGAGGHGLSLTLSPRWGAPTGSAEALWGDDLPAAGTVPTAAAPAAVDGSIAYGFALADTGVLTPFAEASVTEDSGHRVRVGTRFSLEPEDGFRSLKVELGAERSETGFGAPEYQFGLEIGVSY